MRFLYFSAVFLACTLFGQCVYSDSNISGDYMKRAEKLFKEGKYSSVKDILEPVLTSDQKNEAAFELLKQNNEKIKLSQNRIKKALENYNNGMLIEALEELERAALKDPVNSEVKELQFKILTELGMEYSFVGNYKKSQEFLTKAQKLFPSDTTVNELIEMNKSMMREEKPVQKVEEKSDNSSAASEKKIEDLLKTFNEYQLQQDQLLKKYESDKDKLKTLLNSSAREKEKLLELIRAGSNDYEKNKELSNFYKYIILSLAVIGIYAAFRIHANRKLILQENSEAVSALNDKSDYERKIKKLEIIERELAGGDIKENQVGLNMLEEFIGDKDYRIRLKMLNVLHGIDPKTAVSIIENIIMAEKSGPYLDGAYDLLRSFRSEESVNMLIRTLSAGSEDINKKSLEILTNMLNDQAIDKSMHDNIEKNIERHLAEEDWVVS